MMNNQKHITPTLLSTFAAAKWLDATPRYVERMAAQNEIPHYRLPGGEIRFDAAELRKWIRQHRAEGTK